LGALGIYLHQILLLWLGAGVVGGCGLGLAYISPVSTLIKWFPDKRGMATGMAIMGFGGGAMIGAPLADKLMRHFATPTSVGVWETFVVLGVIYLLAMLADRRQHRIARHQHDNQEDRAEGHHGPCRRAVQPQRAMLDPAPHGLHDAFQPVPFKSRSRNKPIKCETSSII
jgi:MFS family permease